MKMKLIAIAGFMGIGVTAVLLSCTKTNFERVAATNDDGTNKAQVQFYNATINTQRTIVFMDGDRLSGTPMVYTQTTATNLNHSGSGITFWVTPGLHAFAIRDTNNTSIQTPVNFSMSLDASKFYTVFTYDTMNAVKQVAVEANLEFPSDDAARVRFANFVFWKNATPPAMDIFSKKLNANIFSNVQYTQVTDFIPFPSVQSDSLIVRIAGTNTALDTATITATPKRSYTLVFRGRYATDEAGGALFPRTLAVQPNN